MIYICVPAHDEGQTVGVVLWKVRQVLGEAGRDYQILVADDGSTDKTSAVLEPYTRVLPLTVMRSERCRGYAASLEMLLREAVHRSEYPRRDVIVVLQADFTEDPDHITALLKRIESGADIAASSAPRRLVGGVRNRLAEMACGYLLRRLAWPEELKDPLTGFHAYRVSVVRHAFETIGSGERLLRWEGRTANAALFQAVQPHARRIDVVDWMPHPERHQRPTRDRPGDRLREVWAFTRNRESPGVIPVPELAPSQVRTARTEEHEVSAEALRAAGVTRPGEEATQSRRPRTRNGKAAAGVKDGRRKRRPDDSSEDDRPRRSRRRKGGKAEAEPEVAAAAVDGADGEAPKKKRRRRRRRKPSGAGGDGGGSDSVEHSSGDAANGEGGEGQRKRRRGRRGGRRRLKSSGEPSGESQSGESTSETSRTEE